MRIKIGEHIREVNDVYVRQTDIVIDEQFYQTNEHTKTISDMLFQNGCADLTPFEVK